MTNDLLLIFTSIGTPDNNITLGVPSENAITTFAGERKNVWEIEQSSV